MELRTLRDTPAKSLKYHPCWRLGSSGACQSTATQNPAPGYRSQGSGKTVYAKWQSRFSHSFQNCASALVFITFIQYWLDTKECLQDTCELWRKVAQILVYLLMPLQCRIHSLLSLPNPIVKSTVQCWNNPLYVTMCHLFMHYRSFANTLLWGFLHR